MDCQTIIHGDKPFVRYYADGGFNTLTYSQVDRIATNLACKWADKVKGTDVVSYIGDHGVDYLILMLAVMKLRITLLAISPRNSEAAVINLLEKTHSKVLITSEKYETLAKSSAAHVSGVQVILGDSLEIATLVQEPLNPDHAHLLNKEFSDEDITKSALIIHSSGSTAFPKPIYLSNRYLFNMINAFHHVLDDDNRINENDTFLSCTPLFHIFGFFTVFSMATVGGKVVFLEKLPASISEIDAGLSQNNCTGICATPLIYEQMIPYLKEKKDFSSVQRLKIAIFGGAPLQREAGEWYQAHGINLRNFYGTTEIGAFMSSDVTPGSKNWLSLKPYLRDPNGNYYAVFETNDEAEPDIKHCYIRSDSPTLATGVCNRADGNYDTNDLFRENPNFPGYYDYLGRRDDTLIMENGEKTNPIPMEATIRQSPMVKQVAVLGHSRQCTAALIEIDMDHAIQYAPGDIISAVQAAVNEANKNCPSHSTILPQMIKILPLNKTLPSTDKGTVMRKKAEAAYQDVVDQLYKDFFEGPSRDTSNKNTDVSTWSPEDLQSFLIDAAAEVLNLPKSTFKDRSQSIFDHGLNSLSSIQLRNRISEYFDDVPQNFLFQHPSISSMCEALMNNCKEDAGEQIEKRYSQTQELAEAYIKKAKRDFPVARNTYSTSKKPKVVMLTGVTGSLGSFMLRDLLLDKSVKKVYAIVRGREEQLMDRLVDAFESRALDSSLLKTDRVEVLPMRFNDPFLGFGEKKYNDLKEEVTIVQHCAWLLNFNMPVDHFDKECIAPFYNLLKFAYHQVNPMHVHFISSISASAASGSVVTEEPLPFDSHVAMPMGYAHSKFVVEMLFNYLTKEKNFPCYIERLGQVCGDSVNGVWNISEQFPLMFIGGGSVMHKMPALDTVIDWITVDYAASSIADIMLRTAYSSADQDQFVYHIVNPKVIDWNDVLQAMRDAGMKFDIVSPADWVEELSKDDTNPAYKLMSFYETNFKEAFKMPLWETKKTSTLTPLISQSPILDSNLFTKFLKRWENVGFYNRSL